MKKTLPALLVFISSFANATLWQVGPTRTYTMPSQVSTLVQSGDIVEIDAGVYPSDVCRWTANNLTLRGVNGMAHLESNGLSYGDKAIWVIQGNNTVVEYIEFSECTSTSQNGAGIRHEALNLTVNHCYFHDNENGILVGAFSPSKFIIEYSEFNHNGAGDGYSHNLYIGHIDTLVFRYNYSHHCNIGHELKSRANVNYILYNRFSNENTGNASREVDLPNGGTSILVGNIIQQGPNGTNSNVIGYGLEGFTNSSSHNLYAVNNTLVNEKTVGSFFQLGNGVNIFKAYNNIAAGGGNFLTGTLPTTLDTSMNIINTSISYFLFTNSSNYNYVLQSSSPARNHGNNIVGMANNFSLYPLHEFFNVNTINPRCSDWLIDCGAFETCIVSAEENLDGKIKITVLPNEIRCSKTVDLIELFDMAGKNILSVKNAETLKFTFSTSGIYFIKVTKDGYAQILKIVSVN